MLNTGVLYSGISFLTLVLLQPRGVLRPRALAFSADFLESQVAASLDEGYSDLSCRLVPTRLA